MGEIIEAKASVEDIISDVTATLKNAQARGGEYQSLAESFVGPIVSVLGTTEGKIAPLKDQVEGLSRDVMVLNDEADDVVKEESDFIWNKVGRPKSDPYLEVIFPGGSEFYTDGKVEEQPARMHLLAELLLSGAHPKLDPAVAAASAQRIVAKADALQVKLDELRPLKTKLDLLSSVRAGLARVGRARLVSLKRAYLAAGFSESDIHQVIPDRPSSRSKKKGAPGAGGDEGPK